MTIFSFSLDEIEEDGDDDDDDVKLTFNLI